jgi:hypothetical protein
MTASCVLVILRDAPSCDALYDQAATALTGPFAIASRRSCHPDEASNASGRASGQRRTSAAGTSSEIAKRPLNS